METLFQKQGFIYERLRLSEDNRLSMNITSSDAKKGNGKNAIRKIFYNTKYDQFEGAQLDECKADMEFEIPNEVLLRFLYGNQFDIRATIKNLESYDQWRNDPKNFKINLTVNELLQSGAVYLAGRGQMYKPIIIVNAALMDPERYSSDDLTTSIVVILSIAQQYMLVPGYVENWLLLIDARKCSAFNIPFNILSSIIQVLKDNFPCYLERLFIFEPQTSIQISWQIVEQFIPFNTRHKIEFISNNLALLNRYITMNQLQQRFGGHMLNIYDYWPPLPIDTDTNDDEQNKLADAKLAQDRLELLKNLQPTTCLISEEIQKLFKKKCKPKNKIYHEETYVDPTEFYRSKQQAKTVILQTFKEFDEVITPQQPRIISPQQQQQKSYQSISMVKSPMNNSRFVGPKSKPKMEMTNVRFNQSQII